MQDGLEPPPRRRVGEDVLAHAAAVEPAVLAEDLRAERVDHGGERRLARLDDLPRDHVRVDHRHAAGGEQVRDRGLAARDAAGEGYAIWGHPRSAWRFKAGQEGTQGDYFDTFERAKPKHRLVTCDDQVRVALYRAVEDAVVGFVLQDG